MLALEMRKYFPIYQQNPDLVYMDTGATALKPNRVLDKMEEYYHQYGVNIHRGVYKLSYQATDAYDIARDKVAKFINQYGVPFLVLVAGFVIWRMRVKHRRKIRIEYASTDERETMSMVEGKKKNDK